ncbi:ParB/RepB/Spo0J family partition protein [Streptomyces exfoliatus]|uniref:ParB/RepB/Spo0J family partition protein n=1 Tax=Streptomyces exfoliatus TaxID=1905 RepID=UPI003C2C9087
MSKAELLGAGSSFQRARPVSARRAAIDQATSAPTEGVAAPTELPLGAVSLNPDNPRSELGDLTDLANSLRDHGQKTAISIMTRFAYLQAHPGREADLEPDTQYVVIDGNSRLAASREAGLDTLKVMLDDELGADPDAVLESALVANIHRRDLDPLDEAKALQQLLKLHGTQEKLAERLHRTQAWVSQRLALLNLTPELQQRLKDGTEQAKHLRRVGNKRPEEQEVRLKQIKAQEAAAKEAQRRALQDGGADDGTDVPGDGSGYNPVMKSPGDGQNDAPGGSSAGHLHNRVMKSSLDKQGDASGGSASGRLHNPVMKTGAQAVPEPRENPVVPGRAAGGSPESSLQVGLRIPWHDGEAVADLLLRRMDREQQSILLARLRAVHNAAPGADAAS